MIFTSLSAPGSVYLNWEFEMAKAKKISKLSAQAKTGLRQPIEKELGEIVGEVYTILTKKIRI